MCRRSWKGSASELVPLLRAAGAAAAARSARRARPRRRRAARLPPRPRRPDSARGARLALVAALAGPVLNQEQRQALPTVVAMVVDKSASQSLADRTEKTRGDARGTGAALRRSRRDRSAHGRGRQHAPMARRSTAPSCSRRCRRSSPMSRRNGSAPSSCSPTGRCMTCPANPAETLGARAAARPRLGARRTRPTASS